MMNIIRSENKDMSLYETINMINNVLPGKRGVFVCEGINNYFVHILTEKDTMNVWANGDKIDTAVSW